MLVTRRAEILIKADPEQIWDFVNDPAQWRASNPEEHFGTEFFTPDKKLATGGRFDQRESVAGVRADMRGHFLHRPAEKRLLDGSGGVPAPRWAPPISRTAIGHRQVGDASGRRHGIARNVH
jgi:hypothetical protein